MRRGHKTLGIVVLWLLTACAGLVGQPFIDVELPLAQIIAFTGIVTAAYIGLEQSALVVSSGKMPQGRARTGNVKRYLWLTLAWALLMAVGVVVQFLLPEGRTVPLAELVSFAGTVSAVYVGGNKANKVAQAGGPAPASEKEKE